MTAPDHAAENEALRAPCLSCESSGALWIAAPQHGPIAEVMAKCGPCAGRGWRITRRSNQ